MQDNDNLFKIILKILLQFLQINYFYSVTLRETC